VKSIRELIAFLKAVAGDSRIPDRDKKVLLGLIALIVSPVDLIPDWIPLFGVLDDFVLVAIICDYFFNHLDDAIVLSHWPWGMKSYTRTRKMARFVAVMTPAWAREKIWKFKPSVYES
jgi:uncharacterized membrane protein YkvA (DUF1232 family)